jgi:hypothetical protein
VLEHRHWRAKTRPLTCRNGTAQRWLAGAERRVSVPFFTWHERSHSMRLRRDFGAVSADRGARAFTRSTASGIHTDFIVATGADHRAVRLVEDRSPKGSGRPSPRRCARLQTVTSWPTPRMTSGRLGRRPRQVECGEAIAGCTRAGPPQPRVMPQGLPASVVETPCPMRWRSFSGLHATPGGRAPFVGLKPQVKECCSGRM